jgi:trehalose/maltose hydrolase-like predicted phosphorylase
MTRVTRVGPHHHSENAKRGHEQAEQRGFAGLRPRGDVLVVVPHLPPEWGSFDLRLRFRGAPLRLRIDRRGVSLDSDALTLRRRDDFWEVLFP